MPAPGGSGSGGVPGGDPPEDGYCCGRYASYWNAFLSYKKRSLSLTVTLPIEFSLRRWLIKQEKSAECSIRHHYRGTVSYDFFKIVNSFYIQIFL